MLSLLVLAPLTETDTVVFGICLFLVLIGLLIYFFYSFWKVKQRVDVSPYTGLPLRYGTELTYFNRLQVNKFISSFQDYYNQKVDFNFAAYDRDTGRIFPKCVAWNGAIRVDWTFIVKKHPGNFVSWGSLSEQKKQEIYKAHESLGGFQTKRSSPNPSPRLIQEEYVYDKPGPLYVDPESKVLIGWMMVPETEMEVLVVQRPIAMHIVNYEQKEKK